MEDDLDMESQLERELMAEQKKLLIVRNGNDENTVIQCYKQKENNPSEKKYTSFSSSLLGPLEFHSLPPNFIYTNMTEGIEGIKFR